MPFSFGAAFSAIDSPFGEDSLFFDPCDGTCEHNDDFFRGGVDFEKLADDLDNLKDSFFSNYFYFDYEKYVTGESRMALTGGQATIEVHNNKIITYTAADGSTKVIRPTGRLNKVKCCIGDVPNISINLQNPDAPFTLSYRYKSAEGLGDEVFETTTSLDYRIDPKYVAIFLDFTSAQELIAFIERTKKEYLPIFKRSIITAFANEIHKPENGGEHLNNLYELIPEFAVEAIGELPDGQEKLWNDLLTLLDHDDTGQWSNFRDSSNAIINLLKGFNDAVFLYRKFYENSTLIKRIYDDLDNSSEVDGLMVSNRTIFCSFLNAVCYANYDKLNITGKTFYLGADYKLDSNLDENYDKHADKIFLEQQEKYTYQVTRSAGGGMAGTGYYSSYQSTEEGFRPMESGAYYHPMDMVFLKQTESNDTRLVPAIFVKDISDTEEEAAINKRIRLGIDVLVVILSLATLVAGPGGFLFLMAIADVTVAVGDIAVMQYEDELKQTKEGRAFLEAWNALYMTAGIMTASPALARLTFSLGSKLLTKIESIASREFVIAVLFRLMIEINAANFTKNTLRYMDAAQTYNLAKPYIGLRDITRLQEAGVSFWASVGKAGTSTEQVLFVVYEGQITATGPAKAMKDRLKDISGVKGQKLLDLLRRIADGIPRLNERGFWQAINESGIAMEWRKQVRPNAFRINLDITIAEALRSGNPSIKFEAELAKEVSKYDQIVFFRNKIFFSEKLKQIAGEFDVASTSYLFEAKHKVSMGVLNNGGLIKEIEKYVNKGVSNFINFDNRTLVLVIGKFEGGASILHPIFKTIKEMGVIVVTDLSKIKNLY